MKRIFDAAVGKCPRRGDFKKFGKTNLDMTFKCNTDIEYIYLCSKGFDDTSKHLLSIGNGMVIFNTGHNYVNMNDDLFENFVTRLKNSASHLKKWVLVAPPAMNAQWWEPKWRCMRNNLVVQKKIDLILKHFNAENVVPMFWKTLHNGLAIDGVHYYSQVYDETFNRVYQKLTKNIFPTTTANKAGAIPL